MRKCSLKKFVLFLAFFVLFSTVHAAVDNGYETANGVPGTCPINADVLNDVFGGTGNGFAACNCTSYTAYRLRLNDVRRNGVLFDNTAWSGVAKWSHAYFWNDTERAGAAQCSLTRSTPKSCSRL